MNKLLITFAVVVVVVLAGFFLLNNSSSTGNIITETTSIDSDNFEDSGSSESSGVRGNVISLTGENFKYVMNGIENPEIRVKQGDKIRVEFTSTGGFHDFVIDELSAATERVRPENGMTSVEFTADKKGTFEYYCSVGEHRQNGMKGKFIVE